MKLKRISWTNYRALKDGEIVADGRNVSISGRNGAGKSSIASIIPFVLFGKIVAKSFNENGLLNNDQIPAAELEFDNGMKFRRTVTADGKNHTYVDGYEMSAGAFNAQVLKLTNGGSMIFNLFEFPTSSWQTQRNFLLANFTDAKEDLPSSDEINSKIKGAGSEVTELDARIKELYCQLREIPDTSVKEINAEIAEIDSKLATLRTEISHVDDGFVERKRNVAADLSRQLNFQMSRFKSLTFSREELLKKYYAVSSVCPTCGAKIPAERVEKARAEIVALGRKAASQAAEAEKNVEQLQAQLATAQAELADAQRAEQSAQKEELKIKVSELEDRRSALIGAKNDIEHRMKLESRISELVTRRNQVAVDIEDLKSELATVTSRRQQLIRKKEFDVNSRFEVVTFKLFKILATTGETRETCEPMIDGVPYANLSKGEKFKAACDILKTLQKHFGVEMPLIIDDAESYTTNSILKLTNQLLLFTVSDGDLRIEVVNE